MAGKKRLSASRIERFQEAIWDHYHKHSRSLPWRKFRNPYRILVSEIMLQQTQVERVQDKYRTFLSRFPDFNSLSKASLKDVLSIWQGLGYNRRAIALRQIAQNVMTQYEGTLPSSVDILMQFPGIGKATASAIAAFAFDQPTVFVETNIRRVFLHFFFYDGTNVHDAELLPFIERTLDHSNPREWYYALMDYGAVLKKGGSNPNRRSLHYQKQAPFEGSHRQLRGLVLRTILQAPSINQPALMKKIKKDPCKIREVLEQLQKEGFIKIKQNSYSIV